MQCLATSWIYVPYSIVHAYVLNEFLTVYCSVTTKCFWKNFMLLLGPFASKLVNYLWHNESLKNVWKLSNRCFRRKMSSITNSSESLKSYLSKIYWSLGTTVQFVYLAVVPKESVLVDLLKNYGNHSTATRYKN